MKNYKFLKNSDEYLSRDFITDIEYIIEKDFLRMSSPCTQYLYMKKPVKINADEIQNLIKLIQNNAKTNQVTIKGLAKVKKIISEYYEEYLQGYYIFLKMFDDLTDLLEVIKENGVHYGTLDDVFINYMHEIERPKTKILNNTNGYLIISKLSYTLNNLLENVINSTPDEQCTYYI